MLYKCPPKETPGSFPVPLGYSGNYFCAAVPLGTRKTRSGLLENKTSIFKSILVDKMLSVLLKDLYWNVNLKSQACWAKHIGARGSWLTLLPRLPAFMGQNMTKGCIYTGLHLLPKVWRLGEEPEVIISPLLFPSTYRQEHEKRAIAIAYSTVHRIGPYLFMKKTIIFHVFPNQFSTLFTKAALKKIQKYKSKKILKLKKPKTQSTAAA